MVWFKQWGWVYWPIAWPGWVVTILPVIFLIHTFRAIDVHSHSVSDTLYSTFPWVALLFLLWNWIAGETSQ